MKFPLAALALMALSSQAFALVPSDEPVALQTAISNDGAKTDRSGAPAAPKGDLLPIAGGWDGMRLPGDTTMTLVIDPRETLAIRVPLMFVSYE